MADIKWIKIRTDIFDNRKIRQIEALPEGDSIIVIWYKLLCLAGTINDNGAIYLTQDIPYTDEMLSVAFNRPLTVVKMALSIFLKFNMIEIVEDIIYVSNWERYQNIDGMEKVREQTKKRVSAYRERQKSICNVTGNATVTQSNATDIDKDKEEDIDINNTINDCNNSPNQIQNSSKKPDDLSLDMQIDTIFKTWNEMKSTIHHRELNDVRKTAIKKALVKFKADVIVKAINNYDLVLRSSWYFNYKWSLEDFLNRKNGLPTFTEEGSNWNSFQNDVKKDPLLLPKEEGQSDDTQSSKPEVPDFLKEFYKKL